MKKILFTLLITLPWLTSPGNAQQVGGGSYVGTTVTGTTGTAGYVVSYQCAPTTSQPEPKKESPAVILFEALGILTLIIGGVAGVVWVIGYFGSTSARLRALEMRFRDMNNDAEIDLKRKRLKVLLDDADDDLIERVLKVAK